MFFPYEEVCGVVLLHHVAHHRPRVWRSYGAECRFAGERHASSEVAPVPRTDRYLMTLPAAGRKDPAIREKPS